MKEESISLAINIMIEKVFWRTWFDREHSLLITSSHNWVNSESSDGAFDDDVNEEEDRSLNEPVNQEWVKRMGV